ADIDDDIPAAARQGGVVAGVPVASQPPRGREQAGASPAPAEQRDVGTGAQRVLDDRAPDERGTAEDQDSHNRRPYRPPPAVLELPGHAPLAARQCRVDLAVGKVTAQSVPDRLYSRLARGQAGPAIRLAHHHPV